MFSGLCHELPYGGNYLSNFETPDWAQDRVSVFPLLLNFSFNLDFQTVFYFSVLKPIHSKNWFFGPINPLK